MRSLRSLRLTPSFFAYFACFAVQNTHLFPLLCSFVLFCGHPPWLRRRRIPTLHSALFSLPFTLDFRCALVNTAFVLVAGFGSRRDPGGSLWPAGRSLTYPSSRSSGWNGGESHCKRGDPPRPGPFCPPPGVATACRHDPQVRNQSQSKQSTDYETIKGAKPW